MSNNAIEEMLHPRSVAIVGATQTGDWGGGGFVVGLTEYGFQGKIYPINPKYNEIRGLKAYPALKDIPGTIDYVISSIPANEVVGMLGEAAEKRVKVVHLFTARFSETGRAEAIELEKKVLKIARESGFRLIGPNCMGIYYPAGGISFSVKFPKEVGPIGMISQSGQLPGDIVLASALRGVYFSKVFSYGNALDLNECDFLEYMADDPETSVILMYIEGVKEGRRFVETLRHATATKPVVILKGGRGGSGARATASHTASLAGTTRTWDAMVDQSGALTAGSVNELVDLAVAFRFLPPIRGRRVGVAGGAGGSSVLAADQCEHAGLDVVPLSVYFREELKNRGVSVWDWLGNPADLSIREDESLSIGLVLELMAKDNNFDVLITIIGTAGRALIPPGVPAEVFLQQQYSMKTARIKPFLAVVPDMSVLSCSTESQEWKSLCETRAALVKLGVPFFPTMERAASAARKVYDYYSHRDGLSSEGLYI